MTKNIVIVILLALVGVQIATAGVSQLSRNFYFDDEKITLPNEANPRADINAPLPSPTEFIAIQVSATGTAQVPARHTITLEAQYLTQGVCVRIKDKDGDGYTFLTTDNGVGRFSNSSCE